MIKSKLFVRFAALGILVSGLFLMLSTLTTHWTRSLIFSEPFRGDRGPFRTYEVFLDKVPPAERVAALKDGRGRLPPAALLRRADSLQNDDYSDADPRGMQNFLVEMILLDADGQVLFPGIISPEAHERIKSIFTDFKASGEERTILEDYSIRKLSGQPVQYFIRSMEVRFPSPPPKTLLILNAIQLTTMIAAVLVTLAVVLYSLRTRAKQADEVMKELSRGNLKARLEITKMDEIGHSMLSFNKMADEIEHLIEHLRKTENARRDLLRELAHDLRTPVASMKSLIETVSMRSDQLPKEKVRDLLDLAMKEAEYFEGLVDDLLFVGRVGEPKYKTSVESVDLSTLIETEVDAILARYSDIVVEVEATEDLVEYDGDPSLLKRLVRNALENAASFAKQKVLLRLEKDDKGVTIRVADDGPGFDSTSLASFGQRKYSRAMTQVGGKRRISIGLGSVIMKSITDVHRGELSASNRMSPNGDILGAEVTMRLPLT